MELYISNSGQEPIYAQITRQIKAKILNGELQQGDALPSIRLLAKELRISVITTKRAYEDLEADAGMYGSGMSALVTFRARPPCMMLRCTPNRGRRSPLSVPPARAKPPCSNC